MYTNRINKNYRTLIKYSWEEGFNKQVPVFSLFDIFIKDVINRNNTGITLNNNVLHYTIPTNCIFNYICKERIEKHNS